MAYLAKIMTRAQRDLEELYSEKNAAKSTAARNWYFGLNEAILTLEDHPSRCPVTLETPKLRHLLYGNKPHIYRVIYRILEKPRVVEILHIRHAARDKFKN